MFIYFFLLFSECREAFESEVKGATGIRLGFAVQSVDIMTNNEPQNTQSFCIIPANQIAFFVSAGFLRDR